MEEKVFHPTASKAEREWLYQEFNKIEAYSEEQDCVMVTESDKAGVRIVTIKTWAVGA